MKIIIGADHRGFSLKKFIKKKFQQLEFIDVGAYNNKRSDYPEFGHLLIQNMQKNNIERGILICASGIGMAIVANRYIGIYAGVVWNKLVAKQCRQDDNCNVLVLPADYVSKTEALDIITIWLEEKFLKGRYQKRIDCIDIKKKGT